MGPARKEKSRVSTYVPPTRTFSTLSRTAGRALKKVITVAPKIVEFVRPAFISSIIYPGELGDSGPEAAWNSQQCPSGIRVKQKAKRWELSVRLIFLLCESLPVTAARTGRFYPSLNIETAISMPFLSWKGGVPCGETVVVGYVGKARPSIDVETATLIEGYACPAF